MSEQAKQLATEFDTKIRDWIPGLESVTPLTSGGSGTILTLHSITGTAACLKLVKCELCPSLKEHAKLVREFVNLARSAGRGTNRSHVIPLLSHDLIAYDPKLRAEVIPRFDELIRRFVGLSEQGVEPPL